MLPTALMAIKDNNFTKGDTNEIESKYFAYIASFGVSVLQSGAYATQLFYEASSSKEKVIKAIKKICNTNNDIKDIDKKQLLDASTALKLAIRSYKKVDNTGEDDE